MKGVDGVREDGVRTGSNKGGEDTRASKSD